jgi:Sensors of blue-light using FAD
MFRRYIYVSKATEGVTAQQVADFIGIAQERNRSEELTGALLFLDGFFLQVMEGPVNAAASCMMRIKFDKRHHHIDIREMLDIETRRFPKLWMALSHADDVNRSMLDAFNYEPGFPADKFSPEKLQRVMVALSLSAWPSDSGRIMRRAG